MLIQNIAVIGECMVELKKTKESLIQGFGGDTLNTAVYLSRLTNSHAITTSYVTALGSDPFSKDMLKSWQKEGIQTELVRISDDKVAGIYAIETTDEGERSFYYWRNDSAAKYWLRTLPLDTLINQLSDHQMIYLSGISLAILPEDCRDKLISALKVCRERGVAISFDNNYRLALWSSPALAQKWYTEILALTNIAFLTFDDEMLLWGDKEISESVGRTRSLGVEEIVIKCGGDACLVISGQEEFSVAPTPVDNIVDTTAAGDSFSAGYLAKRILGGSCTESAKAGHTLAGTVIQHHGAVISKELMPQI
ncbi:sugar kinase [Vibrio sp. HN007]|uniref:sugar kinase n=1 Tax=Vibrio iocasae TaxID=3098914 RepID=UPI0035D49122